MTLKLFLLFSVANIVVGSALGLLAEYLGVCQVMSYPIATVYVFVVTWHNTMRLLGS